MLLWQLLFKKSQSGAGPQSLPRPGQTLGILAGCTVNPWCLRFANLAPSSPPSQHPCRGQPGQLCLGLFSEVSLPDDGSATGSVAPHPPSRHQVVLIGSTPSEGQASEERWRPGSGPRRSHVLSRPPPPALRRGGQACSSSPVAIATGRPLLPELPAPAPGRLAPLPLPEPGAGALEARPGRSRPPGARRPSRPGLGSRGQLLLRTSGLPTFLLGLHPVWSADPKRAPCACPGPPLPAACSGGHSCWDSLGFWWPLRPSW